MERQYLTQIQADIDIHWNEHMEDLYKKSNDDGKNP